MRRAAGAERAAAREHLAMGGNSFPAMNGATRRCTETLRAATGTYGVIAIWHSACCPDGVDNPSATKERVMANDTRTNKPGMGRDQQNKPGGQGNQPGQGGTRTTQDDENRGDKEQDDQNR